MEEQATCRGYLPKAKKSKEPGEEFLTHGHFSHISVWFPALADLTFATKFLPLSDSEARALLKLTEYSRQLARLESEVLLQGSGSKPEDVVDPFSLLPAAARGQLVALGQRLDEALQELAEGSQSSGAFVRLDTRSPKDAVFSLPRVRELLQATLLERHFSAGPWSVECQTYDEGCMHRAIIAAQEVHTGREALELLRHSQRVEADLVVGQMANSGDASSQLVIRRWDRRVDPLCEVRAFVRGGRVTAISQYYSTCLVPDLLRQPEQVCRLVCEAVGEIHSRIKHLVPDDPQCAAPFYAVDFALIFSEASSNSKADSGSQPQAHFERALLVEINPPPPVSGTVLFNWNDADDRALLTGQSTGGSTLPVLRLVETAVPWESVPFHPPLKSFADSLRGRLPRRRLLACCRRRRHKLCHLD